MGSRIPSECNVAFNVFRFHRAVDQVRRDEILEPAKATRLAAHAVLTGDKFLAAEILFRLGTLPPRSKDLSRILRAELEGVISAPDVGDALGAIAAARQSAHRRRAA